MDYYDREGKPLTQEQWMTLFETMDRIIERTELPEFDAAVSTVWLGLDHGWGEGHAPQIFETLVFGGKLDQYMLRYATEAEAREGHAEVVFMVTHQLNDVEVTDGQ